MNKQQNKKIGIGTRIAPGALPHWVGTADRFAGNNLQVRDISLFNQSVSCFTARLLHPTGEIFALKGTGRLLSHNFNVEAAPASYSN